MGRQEKWLQKISMEEREGRRERITNVIGTKQEKSNQYGATCGPTEVTTKEEKYIFTCAQL